ncbi:MAG: hypothetical protein V4439_03715 [Patescibacteria group bacterium]
MKKFFVFLPLIIIFLLACTNNNSSKSQEKAVLSSSSVGKDTLDMFKFLYEVQATSLPILLHTEDSMMSYGIEMLHTFKYPKLQKEFDAVFKNVENYKKIIREGLLYAKGIEFDFIAQTHLDAMRGEHSEDSHKSQWAIFYLLEFNKYEAVGVEDATSEEVSLKTMEKEMIQGEKELHGVDYKGQLLLDTMKPENFAMGDVRYWLSHKDKVHLFGLQDRPMATLNLKSEYLDDFPDADKMQSYLMMLRSYLAFAKASIAAHKHGYKKIAIIMGLWHTNDFFIMAKRFGVHMQFYDCSGDRKTFNDHIKHAKSIVG